MGGTAVTIADFHLAGATEIITCRHIDVIAQQYIGSQGQVTTEALTPVRQSAQCSGKTQGRMPYAFGSPQLQVKGDTLELIVVSLYLSTKITGNGGNTQVKILIVVVCPKVNTDSNGVITTDIGRDEFGGDTATDRAGESVGKGAAKGDVTSGKSTEFLIVSGLKFRV